ncbi:MAG: ExbD/TolR family protein [Proteobacteria bacterium]|nr:ExbD/TolR family protein [Pseudomonadota bacterium]
MDDKELFEGTDDVGLISDINVIPFIDIMLVLLIIFMVTAPLMMGGVRVNLPKSGGDPLARPEAPLIVSLDAENRVFVDKDEVAEAGRHQRFQELARMSESGEVYVRGDGEVKYARMMELMGELGQAGFARVILVTDVSGKVKAPGHGEGDKAEKIRATSPSAIAEEK